MSSNQAANDEIDLSELIKTIWHGKWIVFFFVLFSLTLTWFYNTKNVKPEYQIIASFQVNLYPVFTQQICESNFKDLKDLSECLNTGTVNTSLNILGSDWRWDERKKHFISSTEKPDSSEKYKTLLDEAAKKTTAELEKQAIQELNIIETELSTALANTERAATNFLNTKRLLSAIENGKLAILFSAPSVAKKHRAMMNLALAVMLGGFIGIGVTLLLSAFRKENNQSFAGE